MLPEYWRGEDNTQHILLCQHYPDAKQDKNIARKENYRVISCVNTDAKKFLTKF